MIDEHYPRINGFGTFYYRNQEAGIRYEYRKPPLFMVVNMNSIPRKCWCGKLIVKPRRRYCSDRHYNLWYFSINTRWESFRDQVLRRDNYICQECGYQPKVIKGKYSWDYDHVDDRYLQADHILAIINGGMCFDLENIRTLCVDCHKKKTANDIREKFVKRKAELFVGLDSFA